MNKVFFALLGVIALAAAAFLGASAMGRQVIDLRQPAMNSIKITSSGFTLEDVKTAVLHNESVGQFFDLWRIEAATGTTAQNPAALPVFQADECWTWALTNPGFESMDSWYVPVTEYSAAYSQEEVLAGEWSMKTGITDMLENRHSYSSASQLVTIPPEVELATLQFSLYPVSTEPETLGSSRWLGGGAAG